MLEREESSRESRVATDAQDFNDEAEDSLRKHSHGMTRIGKVAADAALDVQTRTKYRRKVQRRMKSS